MKYQFYLGALVAVSATATAHANVEVGGFAGVHFFSHDNELGVPNTPDAASERNSAIFGLRLGVFFTDMFGIEGELGVIPTETRSDSRSLWNLAYRGSVVAQFRAADPENALIPFVLAGGGGMSLVSVSNRSDEIKKDTDAMFHVGVGVKYRLPDDWGLRGDARLYLPPSSASTSFTEDYELLVSLYREFGREHVKHATPPPPSPAPTPVDDNPDGDGIRGNADQCPNEAEDKDGFADDDGCSDTDNDGDGILDAADQCPNEAEDKDGFADDDGCPDADNDRDGIADPQDGCPNEPETKNGFEDDDGCPDTVPAQVKKFTGKIEGIRFKTGAATLLGSSNAVLDQAVATLAEYPKLSIGIGGHTDDVPLRAAKGAKYQSNEELSQARADSVRTYLIAKGIAPGRIVAKGYGASVPVEDPAGLVGAKLSAARAKNRRVEFRLQ